MAGKVTLTSGSDAALLALAEVEAEMAAEATAAAGGLKGLVDAIAQLRAQLAAALPKTPPAIPTPAPTSPRAPPAAPTPTPRVAPQAKVPAQLWSQPVGKAPAQLRQPKDKPIQVQEAGNKGAKLAAHELGISKAQLRAPGTAAAIDLTKLALGIRGMAQLQAIETRAGYQLRQLFTGVDASPVVRAADRLSQVFNKTSVTGQALQGIFGRAFNYIFGQVEKLAPYAHTAFQGMVLAALLLENGFLRASIAVQPITDAIEDFIGPAADMETAALLGGIAFIGLAIAAAAAAIPIVAVGAAFEAVSRAIGQAIKLYREWDGRAIDKARAGVGEAGERAAQGSNYRSDADLHLSNAEYAKRNLGGGSTSVATGGIVNPDGSAVSAPAVATGKAYADGLAQGITSGIPKVAGAASALAGIIDPTVRTKTETHSPSRQAARTGAEQPAGFVEGMDGGIPDVRAAADRMGAAANAGGRSSGGSAPASSSAPSVPTSAELHFHFPGVTSAVAQDDIRTSVRAALREELRAISLAFGRPVAIT